MRVLYTRTHAMSRVGELAPPAGSPALNSPLNVDRKRLAEWLIEVAKYGRGKLRSRTQVGVYIPFALTYRLRRGIPRTLGMTVSECGSLGVIGRQGAA